MMLPIIKITSELEIVQGNNDRLTPRRLPEKTIHTVGKCNEKLMISFQTRFSV